MAGPWKVVPCRYFDEYGAVKNNRDRCRFYQAPSSCRFIHPSDLEWRIVQSPPRRRDSGYSARNRSRSRSPIRRRSLSKDSTRDRYPSRRPSSIESDRFSRRRDRSSSIAEPRLSRTDTLQSPVVPTGPRRLSVDQPPSTTSIVSSATVEDMKPAMPPPAIPAAEPKPVLPSSEDIRKIWITRIKIMSDCVSARSEHVKWEKDVRVWRQHLESSGFPNLMPDEKKKIEEGHEHATKECERLKGVMDTAVYQLLELDEFWPVLANDGSTDRQELIKMQADVAQLMASALAIKNGPEDSAETSAVGAKRKRPTADDGSQSFRQLEKELEKIGEDVTTLSGRVADQENDLTEQQEEIMANLNEKIDNKFTELKESWTKTTGHEKKKMRDLNKAHTELKGRVDDVELNSENTSSIVNELSREIEEVKTAAAAQRQEAAIRQEEIRLCTAKFEQLQEKQQQQAQEMDKVLRENAALSATIQAHIQLRSQPAPPTQTLEEILDTLEEPIQARIRAALTPYLEQHYSEITIMLQNHNELVRKDVWDKLDQTLEMTELIMAWIRGLDSAEQGAVAT